MQSPQASARQRKKTINACKSCRIRKLRCSGRNPCERCSGRNETCVFEEKERRLVVSVDHLTNLHDRIQSLESQLQASQSRAQGPHPSHQEVQHSDAVGRNDVLAPSQSCTEEVRSSNAGDGGLTNTLVTSEPPIKVHRHGHAAYLGHSSTLSFSRNVRNLLVASSHVADISGVSVEREDASYVTPLPPIALDLSRISLPRLAHAEYLTSTVHLGFGSLYSLFDPALFLAQLRAFYEKLATGSIIEPSLWHIQMLLVLGLGKSMLTREHSEAGPAGMDYFTKAVEAMSDIRRLYQDPFLSIEILCLTALFMHAADMLQESYVTIGSAIRIATTKIMNVYIPEALHPPNVEYQRRLFWTAYCIDRKNSSMLGSTMVVRDEDISIPFPQISAGDEAQNVFTIHVTLSSHLGKILDVIYGVHGQNQRSFMTEVKEILERLVETLVVLREHLELGLDAPSRVLSREAATLHLLLHQCVILTVRPVLYSLLKPLLNPDRGGSGNDQSSSLFDSMLKMCVESAIQILQITSALKQNMICDLLFPYDIDALFSAAYALILIDMIRPANKHLWDFHKVIQLLDEYVARHVAPAQAYRSDLLQLLQLRTKVNGAGNASHARSDNETATGADARMAGHATTNPGASPAQSNAVWSQVRPGNECSGPTNLETMISVIDDLNVYDTEFTDNAALDLSWMWEHDDFWAALA